MATYGSERSNLLPDSILTPSDSNQNKRNYFQCLNTIPLAGIHLLISITIFGVGAYFELNWMIDFNCNVYFLLLYVRCLYWAFTYVIDAIVTRRHSELRLHGYHDFYRHKILNYKNAPLSIVTLCNMIIFLIQTLMQHIYGADLSAHCQRSLWSPITYVCLLCGVETIVLMIVHGTYIMNVWHFNRITCLPDALRDIEQPFIGSLGISVENGKVADLLEKQADLIYYLKEQNVHLNRKLLQLSQRNKQRGYYSY